LAGEDDKQTVSKYIVQQSKALGVKISPKSFVRFNVGEGIEKEETDYAGEVAAMAAGTA